VLRAATRGSELARWQTDHVGNLLIAAGGPPVEPVIVSTTGDRRTDTPIHEMGGKGVFVKEVQAAVIDGRADVAVHSAKDLPAVTPEGLVLGAIPARADARDALVGARLADLPPGAVIATGSVRRRAQLAWHRPDLTFAELRGNISTRLEKANAFTAIVMAAAALDRLGERPEIVDRLDPSVVLPQVGQGALAVECRVDDRSTRDLLGLVEDRSSRRAVDAERAFLSELGGDCDLPAGAHAIITNGSIQLTGMLASLDGRIVLRETRTGSEADELGRSVARHLLDTCGGADLLVGPRD
jgi:hydroxymethylbilane synthase